MVGGRVTYPALFRNSSRRHRRPGPGFPSNSKTRLTGYSLRCIIEEEEEEDMEGYFLPSSFVGWRCNNIIPIHIPALPGFLSAHPTCWFFVGWIND